MLDISNKLHAMVDEFVSNLTSECDVLVNNVSAQGHKSVAHDSGPEGPRAGRPSNRTTLEVLKGLTRPSESQMMDKSHNDRGRSNIVDGIKRTRDNGRSSRQLSEMQSKSASSEGVDHKEENRSVDLLLDDIVTKAEVKQPRPAKDTGAKGKFVHTVEILSSDHSSDDSLIPLLKSCKKKVGKQNSSKAQKSTSRGISTGKGIRSPSTSPESSHVMNYSYEEDTLSLGSKNPPVETTFPKLKWPEDVGDVPEDGSNRKRSEQNEAELYSESHRKHERKEGNEETSMEEGNESSDEEAERRPNGTESDVEELPVLPKVPVKRKLMSEPKGSERRAQRGRTKSSSPQVKKQRTPQIDASVITKLEFDRRPTNSVSIQTYSL